MLQLFVLLMHNAFWFCIALLNGYRQHKSTLFAPCASAVLFFVLNQSTFRIRLVLRVFVRNKDAVLAARAMGANAPP